MSAPLSVTATPNQFEHWKVQQIVSSARLTWNLNQYASGVFSATGTLINTLGQAASILFQVVSASSNVTFSVTPVGGAATQIATVQGPGNVWVNAETSDTITVTYNAGSGFGTNYFVFPQIPQPPVITLTITVGNAGLPIWNWSSPAGAYPPPISGTNPPVLLPGGNAPVQVVGQFFWPADVQNVATLTVLAKLTNLNQVSVASSTLTLHEAPGSGIGYEHENVLTAANAS